MRDEWKSFLLQWMAPVGIFGVILIFLFTSFGSSLKTKSATEYDNALIRSTDAYALAISESLERTEAVANSVSDIVSKEGLSTSSTAEALDNIVKYSECYMAVLCSSDGKGYTNQGENVDLSSNDYFEQVYSDVSHSYYFVDNDGVTNNPALVMSVNSEGENPNNRIIVFYPFNAQVLKKYVTVESDFDILSYSVVTTRDGVVLTSSGVYGSIVPGVDVWERISTTGNSSNVRRVKTKAQSGNSGVFEVSDNGTGFYISYSTIPGTDRILMLFVTANSVNKSINKSYSAVSKKLGWIIAVLILFVLVVTGLNISQIFISTRNKEDLKDKADTDQLTGLKNKIATEREIKEYIENHPDGLAMMFLIDIDNFKKINDTMGHAFGDEVLRELGRHIGINFRVSDVIGRTGGDEFTVFLKNLKEDANTLREAQKLVYFFKHFQVGDYVKYTVTASIGAAVFPAHGADFETLYKAADAAVYKSKKRGKNQLSFYDDRDRTPEEVAYADAHLIDIERKEETPIES